MDELDEKILRALQEDSRQSFRDIADQVDSTPVTVINRVRDMEDEGVIRGYTADIDYEKVGYNIRSVISITAEGPELRNIEESASEFDNIQYVYEVTGDTDVVLFGHFKDMEDLQTFVKEELLKDPNIQTVTHVVTKTYKESPIIEIEIEEV